MDDVDASILSQVASTKGIATPVESFLHGDVISGMRFVATMQMRTPLRVLLRHGEIFDDLPNQPPIIAREEWEGIWTPKIRTLREMGIDMDEPDPGRMASSVGPIPIDGGKYLQMLIAVRKIVEAANPILERIAVLMAEMENPRWVQFNHHWHHSARDIRNYFFPSFLDAIPRLPVIAKGALDAAGLTTPATLAAADDARLLAVSGIGKKVLENIRTCCDAATTDRECDRIDTVHR